MKGGVCVLNEHLALTYELGGLGALIRQGADWVQILTILSDARTERGITEEEEKLARQALDNSKKSRHGRLIRLPHEKYQAALDRCLFSLKSNLVITPTNAYYRGGEEELEILGQHFECFPEHDEIYRIEGNLANITKVFMEATKH